MSTVLRSACFVVLALAAAECSPATGETASTSRTLRVCADPNNLPYSNQQLEGFENKIATLVGSRMHARIEYVWWAQRRGFLRNTLRAGLCDVVMELPAGMDMAATTQPYYRSSYVFVTRKGAPHPQSFDDPYLSQATIGVHLIGDDFANSPPAHALSKRGLVGNVRGYSIYGDYTRPNPPAALIEAVASGAVDVAVAWGPLAGYFASVSHVPLEITPVHPDEEPPFPFVYAMAMAVDRSNTSLRDELDHVIAANHAEINRILREYGVPLVEPAKVATR